jgi:16S rRNA U516 pseudouridylate synthase RsuA-like enzyme
VALKNSKRDELRRVLFTAQHPVEKLKRIALGPLTLEGLPQGHYRLLSEAEAGKLRRALASPPKIKVGNSPQRARSSQRRQRTDAAHN